MLYIIIKINFNGIIYQNGNFCDFCEKIVYLIDNPKKRNNIAIEAYKTIINEWNVDNAVNKLFRLYNNLINHRDNDIESGICSNAKIIKDNKNLYKNLISGEK